MKNDKEKRMVVWVTPEEMQMLTSNREKRKKKYLRHLKRKKKMQKMKRKIANSLYPVKQRLYGAGALGTGLVGFRFANGDGEIMFCALFLALTGVFILFTRKNVFDYDVCTQYLHGSTNAVQRSKSKKVVKM